MRDWIIRLYRSCRDFGQEMNKNHISAYASSAAFFLFLSLIPFLLLILACIPFTSVTQSDLLRIVLEIVPRSVDALATNIIVQMYRSSPAILSVSAIAAVWSAARGILAMIRGLNTVNGVTETRNYILLRIRACVYTILLLVAILLSLVILVYGNSLYIWITTYFPRTTILFSAILKFRFLLTLTLLSLFFLVLFKVLPNRSLSISEQIPGAVFTAVVWSAFSWGFSVYIDRFNGFSMYGNLATVAILMLWLYFCMYLMLLGAQINVYFEPAFTYYRIYLVNRKKRRKKGIGA